MKTKLIHANFDENTGTSVAIIRNKYGTFTGIAHLHPDEKYPSSFKGCEYAEVRAYAECAKYQIALINAQIKALEDLEKTLKNKKEYDPYIMECRQLRKRIYELKVEKQKIKEYRIDLYKTLKTTMENRDTWLDEKMKEKGC